MRSVVFLTIMAAAAGFFSGCVIYPTGSAEWSLEEEVYEQQVYVDTWLTIPYGIKQLLEPYVEGYFSPELSRYPYELYPQYAGNDPYDLPCYVRSDFNGDYYDDFAFLFSSDVYENGYWYTATRLLVVLSDGGEYFLSADIALGEVEKTYYDPEEFWAIGLMAAGRHTVSSRHNGVTITETISLDYDGVYLNSLDPTDQSVYFAEGCELFVMEWSEGSYLAKKKAGQKPTLVTKKVQPGKSDK